jgi:hypothetical protein
MPDYEFKSYILNELPEALEAMRNTRKFGYYFNQLQEKHKDILSPDSLWWNSRLSQLEPYVNMSEELIPSVREECDLILNADKERRKRLRKRINLMFMQGRCYFVTLTFSDEVLSKTSSRDRRIKVTRFLKSISKQYVGNVDYGKTTEREHYHAIILSEQLDNIQYHYFNQYGWVCDACEQFAMWSNIGFYTIKSCNKDENDIKKLASYVTKLTNHAIKETTKRNALIYSR